MYMAREMGYWPCARARVRGRIRGRLWLGLRLSVRLRVRVRVRVRVRIQARVRVRDRVIYVYQYTHWNGTHLVVPGVSRGNYRRNIRARVMVRSMVSGAKPLGCEAHIPYLQDVC